MYIYTYIYILYIYNISIYIYHIYTIIDPSRYVMIPQNTFKAWSARRSLKASFVPPWNPSGREAWPNGMPREFRHGMVVFHCFALVNIQKTMENHHF